MRESYNPVERFLGTGALDEYSVDMKITSKEHLHIIKVDDTGEVVFDVRGNDTEYLESVVFDEEEGGVTITLIDALETNYKLIVLLADDGPIQTFRFRNLANFTLRQLENALDWIAGWGQRHQYLIDKSLKMHDVDDFTEFDMVLPAGLTDETSAGKILRVNETYDGWELADPEDVLADVASNSDDPFTVTDGMTDENVTDMIVYGALQSSAVFDVEVVGSGIGGHYKVSVYKLDGDWEVAKQPFNGSGDPEMDFDVEDATAEDAQVTVTSTSNVGDRTLKFKKVGFGV